ncbi:MAG: hypothetical protein IT227_08480 [Flavobacteriales bacterium]|jgi:hypothetical protein|nr:hypothetical protein [Flavobacteriales bacterium]
MTATERFTSMHAVRAELQRRTVLRDARRADLRQEWAKLQDPRFRRDLVGTGVRQAFSGIPWLKALRGLFTPSSATAGQVVGMALGAGRKTPVGRVAGMVAGLVLPVLIERMATPERTGQVVDELRRSWDRLRGRWRERRERRQDGE